MVIYAVKYFLQTHEATHFKYTVHTKSTTLPIMVISPLSNI